MPLKGINRSGLKLLLLLLLDLSAQDSPLITENLPFDIDPAESIELLLLGQDFRFPNVNPLLAKLLFSLSLLWRICNKAISDFLEKLKLIEFDL